MELRPDRFVASSELMARRVQMGPRGLATAAANLSHASCAYMRSAFVTGT